MSWHVQIILLDGLSQLKNETCIHVGTPTIFHQESEKSSIILSSRGTFSE